MYAYIIFVFNLNCLHLIFVAAAEELYIAACQQLDGYGQETFSARNDDSVEVMLGISVSGIIVATTSGYKFYKWRGKNIFGL